MKKYRVQLDSGKGRDVLADRMVPGPQGIAFFTNVPETGGRRESMTAFVSYTRVVIAEEVGEVDTGAE